MKALVIAFGLAFLIRYFLFGSYIVDGPSMKPNFHTGERLIVNKLLYDIRAPKRGEVVVFHATQDKDFIKRVIALPGETIKVQGDTVYINGQPLDEPYLKEVIEQAKQAGRTYNDLNAPELKVPEGHVFVMGDNRSDSTDSRMIGPVEFGKVVGRAEIVFWPLADIGRIH
ncbi:signal peptidase I [Paenibacillus hodogayensis]|uniref:Signal peptidase I n=1 Tax=Paenibacillus hodogayensis TaxID=279208 RepID=A0ABV5W2I2_9BACL